MGLFRRTPELFSEQRDRLWTPRSTRRWGVLGRTVLRFAQMALAAVVLLLGRRGLEGLGLSFRPAMIVAVAVAAAVLVFGGPLAGRRRDVPVPAPPPPIDPELMRQVDTFPDVRSGRSMSWRTTTGPDGHVHTEFHERGPDGQTRDRAYDGPASGAAWKALRAVLRRLV